MNSLPPSLAESEIGPGLIILGMHRSGTSATAGVMHHLGMHLGSNLVPADLGINDKGYWENSDANIFNSNLMMFLGSAWYDIFEYKTSWSQIAEQEGFSAILHRIMLNNFKGARPWALKDPRLCRLLPFWQKYFLKYGIQVSCLTTIRHPIEVAQSLSQRDSFNETFSLLLWLRHTLDGELNSRGLSRSVLEYENLLRDWRAEIDRVKRQLDIQIDTGNFEACKRVDEFLDKNLRHHGGIKIEAKSELQRLAIGVYESVLRYDIESLDIARAQMNFWIESNRPWIEQINRLHNRWDNKSLETNRSIKEANRSIKETNHTIKRLECIIEQIKMENFRIKNSRSWRWTKWLRKLTAMNKQFFLMIIWCACQ